MSLKALYEQQYGSMEPEIEAGETIVKLADAFGASEEDIAQALFEEGLIDEDGNWLVVEDEEDVEKTAEDLYAGGQIMAHGLMDELDAIQDDIEKGAAGAGAGKAAAGRLARVMARLRAGKAAVGRGVRKKYVKYPAAGLGVAGVGAGGYAVGKRRGRR